MTKILHCEGASDDTFGVYFDGTNGEDYDNCASGKPIAFRLTSGDESMLVVGQYAPGEAGGWLIGVAPDGIDDDSLDDERPIPSWPMRFELSDRPYSPRLVIEAPADVTIRHVGKD